MTFHRVSKSVLWVALILALSAFCNVEAQGDYSADLIRDPNDPLIQEWLADQREHVGVKAERTFVTIANGTLEGTTYTAVGGDTIYAYLGIPFAEAPVGNLRFQPPKPYNQNWGDDPPRVAYLHPNACPQYLTNTTKADEDCLFVSVYTKRANGNTDDPLPVMVWYHGGGFLLGQTSYYTASKLMMNDVVVVTVQYRMGPLGFLSTLDDVVAGNAGMKDMVQALKWVQDNVAAFGGDPGRVTVFGESAGGAAATFLLISPLAKGLFHAAAAMSGTAIAEWSMDRDPLGSTYKLAEAVGCSIDDHEALRECMVEMDWFTLSKTHFELMLNTQAGSLKANLAGTSPTVEHNHTGAFIAREPLELLEHGEIMEVPVMMGANQHEGSFLLGIAWALHLVYENRTKDEVYVHDKMIGDLLATWGVEEDTNGASISQALAAGFIPEDNTRTNFTSIQYNLIDMFSALFMKAPILRTAEILSRRTGKDVFFYSFEYASRSSLWNFLGLVPIVAPVLAPLIPPFDGGTTHGDDLLYMFTFPSIPTKLDQEMTKTYCTFFTNFATTGKPSNDWAPFTVNSPNYMQIKSQPTLKQHYPAAWKQGLTFPEQS